jgi:hypothetical protein
MSFSRLRLVDWVAFVAALALLLVMALDWYTTQEGADLRRDAGLAITGAQTHGQAPDLKGAYNTAANGFEKNAWQEHAAIDRIILVTLLLAAVAAVIAAFMRAAGRRFKSRLTPSAVAAVAAVAAAVMLFYRILQPPGWNPAAVVKVGAPLGLLCAAVLAIAERIAVRYERDGTAWSRVEAKPDAGGAPATGTPAT